VDDLNRSREVTSLRIDHRSRHRRAADGAMITWDEGRAPAVSVKAEFTEVVKTWRTARGYWSSSASVIDGGAHLLQ
jgi:hypothetical protein